MLPCIERGKVMTFMLLNFVVQRQVKLLITELALLIPFCEIQTNGIDPDQAKSVNVKKPGSLSSDFQVLTKVIIQYC